VKKHQMITDMPVVSIESGLPSGVDARRIPSGEIVFWDGRRQYYTGVKEDGERLMEAIAHHFDRGGQLQQ
jgi:hypothetical protein